MKKMNIRLLGIALVVLLWAGLTLGMWFGPREALSESERRPLAQAPELSLSELLSGKFMGKFEDFTLDQFPLRDSFRTIKSLFHYNVLGQKDNNGIYLSQGYAVQQEYPLDEASLAHALNRFQYVYDTYLADQGSKVVFGLIPDKGQYLARESGNLALDYGAMAEILEAGMPWAAFLSLKDTLAMNSYYFTDTHWRQEELLPAAKALCSALEMPYSLPGDFTQSTLDRPFYGVYYGQAAIPMDPEPIYYLESDLLSACRVYDYETDSYTPVYNLDLGLTARDPYELFLSGPKSLLRIENPNGKPGRELIIFRDSFGSAIAPLLVSEYETVTLVDIRYLQAGMLGNFLDFHGQDVLFLYSSLVLNNSETIK